MVQNMRANGLLIKQKERVHFGMQRETFMTVNLRMTKLMATEFTHMLMAQDMRVIGRMICKKDKAVRSGVIMLDIQETIRKGRNMAMVCITG